MKGERITIARYLVAGNGLPVLSDVIDADQIYSGFRVYKRNTDSPGGLAMPGAYDVLLCQDAVTNMTALAGRQAVVCLEGGQLLLRRVEITEEPGAYDLHDFFGDTVSIARNVRPAWGACLVMGAVDDQWELMLGSGEAQNTAGSLQ